MGSWAEERESERGPMHGLTLSLSQTQELEGVGETSGYDHVQQGGVRPGSGAAERDSSTRPARPQLGQDWPTRGRPQLTSVLRGPRDDMGTVTTPKGSIAKPSTF